MKETDMKRVFRDNNRLFTENLNSCKGIKVYGEKLLKHKDKEL